MDSSHYWHMPAHMFDRCEALQHELDKQGISASLKDCHDLLVAEALERIRAEMLDTV